MIYRRSLEWVLDNPVLMLIVFLLTVALNVVVIIRIPKGFFPQQDTGVVMGMIQGPQDASFPLMNFSVQKLMQIVKADPAIAHANGYTGGGGRRRLKQRRQYIYRAQTAGTPVQGVANLRRPPNSAMDVINRLRPKMNALPIASAFLQPGSGSAHRRPRKRGAYINTPSRATAFDLLAHWGPDPARSR